MTQKNDNSVINIAGQSIDVGSAAKHLVNLAQAQDGLAIVRQVIDFAEFWQTEQNKREKIRARRDVMIAEIEKQQRVMETYFEGVFNERRHNFDRLYDVLHTALEKEQWEVVDKAMTAIVDMAKEFPLDDLDKFRTAWNDPDGPELEF